MEENKHINWKLLGVLASLFLVTLALILFTGGKVTPRKSPPVPSPTPKATTSQAGPSSDSVSPKEYQDQDFSLRYPAGVTAKVNSLAGGGKSIKFSMGKENFGIELQVAPSVSTSLQKMSSIFTFFKYQESPISVDGHPAKKYSGALKAEKQSIQETAVIWESSGKVFKLQLTYNSPTRIKKYDDLFNQILAGFKFNK